MNCDIGRSPGSHQRCRQVKSCRKKRSAGVATCFSFLPARFQVLFTAPSCTFCRDIWIRQGFGRKTGLRPVFETRWRRSCLRVVRSGRGLPADYVDRGGWNYCWFWSCSETFPPLIWMAFAEGPSRFVAACVLAVIHFMNQPVYNSLIAQHIPASRRSLGYGFSNMMCFGIGAFGPYFAGQFMGDTAVYGGLAAVATAAGLFATYSLIVRDRQSVT